MVRSGTYRVVPSTYHGSRFKMEEKKHWWETRRGSSYTLHIMAALAADIATAPVMTLTGTGTGPDIDLNFPDTHFGSGTGPRLSCYVAMDRRPTEEQALAGELAGFTALGTREECQCPSGCPALLRVWTGRNTGSTCHECHRGKQESADGPRHCISGLHALTLNYTGLYTYSAAPSRASPGCLPGTGKNRSCKGKECRESAGTFRNA